MVGVNKVRHMGGPPRLLGQTLGKELGAPLGVVVGEALGNLLGESLGVSLGIALGKVLGVSLGTADGNALGATLVLGDTLVVATTHTPISASASCGQPFTLDRDGRAPHIKLDASHCRLGIPILTETPGHATTASMNSGFRT